MMFNKKSFFLSLLLGLSILFGYFNPLLLEPKQSITIAIALVMIICWISELLPLAITAFFPLVLFPIFGVSTLSETASHYSDPIIFLFMGGFFLAIAIEKWNLHKRFAMTILSKMGNSSNRIVMGSMLASFLVSMWISNTATTLMMFPISLSVLSVVKVTMPKNAFKLFAPSVLLGVAYGANLGGLCTIIGTPPNTVFVGFIHDTTTYKISFLQWMLVCVPIAIAILFCLYLVLTKLVFRVQGWDRGELQSYIQGELDSIGKMSDEEKKVVWIFVFTALAWICKDLLNKLFDWTLQDATIAMISSICLFAMPARSRSSNDSIHNEEEDGPSCRLLEWKDTKNMAWGILMMFGGGLALAHGLEENGIMKLIGEVLATYSPNNILGLIIVISALSIFLSEVLSNVAQVIIMTPIVTSLALNMEINPLLVGIPMTLAASCAGMLPMGTPPNAIVYSSGIIEMKTMIRAGFLLNLLSILFISFLAYLLIPLIM